MSRFFPRLIVFLFLALAACESAEERAERHYQSGIALLEEGDVDRALVEFRNVFVANPRHSKARLAYADAQRGRGHIADAYGQYVNVIELEPENTTALIALAEIATLSSGWDEAETYGRQAAALAPDDLRVDVIVAMLDYRRAVLEEGDTTAAAAAAATALERDPDSFIARKVVIDHAIMQGDIPAALQTVEEGLARDPTQAELHVLRIGLLRNGDDVARTQAALEDMAALFPDNPDIERELVNWYIAQDDLSAAEAYLRQLAAAPEATQARKLTVVDFLRQTKGVAAATEELERLIASEADNSQYRVLRATFLFAADQRDEAMAELQDIIATAEASDRTRDYKIVLARMQVAQGDRTAAEALVSDVLAEDAGHVDALRMQADWLIAADDPGGAIVLLRQALSQAPRDVSLIMLLGTAHERAGDHDLAGERYAAAVEISGQAVGPSLRHADFLLGRDRLDSAEAVIAAALTVTPGNVDLLATMAEILLRKGDWNRVTRIIWQLRAMDTPRSLALADETALSLLDRQQRFDETSALLQAMIADGSTSIVAKARLVESQIRAGRLDDARAFLTEQLAATPEDPTLRFLQADIAVLTDDVAAGEAAYRDLLAELPENEHVLGRLYGMLLSQDRQADADQVVDGVLAAAPDAVMANIIKASRLEEIGDFEGAIAIYEALYARDSGNLIVANNLASLITAHRDDAADVERAYAIAARMRGTDVPQFQDTLGWIAYQRGNYEEALGYLVPAAQGLPEDALTHYHLGLTLIALDRAAEAKDVLATAVELGAGRDLPQLAHAQDLLAGLTE